MRAEQEGRDQVESQRVLHPQDGGAESAFTDLAGEGGGGVFGVKGRPEPGRWRSSTMETKNIVAGVCLSETLCQQLVSSRFDPWIKSLNSQPPGATQMSTVQPQQIRICVKLFILLRHRSEFCA